MEHDLSKACWVPPFEEMEKDGMHDMFCPFGQNRMVLIHGLMDREHDKDEDQTDLTPDVIIPPPSDLGVDPDAMFEPDAEDLVAILLSTSQVCFRYSPLMSLAHRTD